MRWGGRLFSRVLRLCAVGHATVWLRRSMRLNSRLLTIASTCTPCASVECARTYWSRVRQEMTYIVMLCQARTRKGTSILQHGIYRILAQICSHTGMPLVFLCWKRSPTPDAGLDALLTNVSDVFHLVALKRLLHSPLKQRLFDLARPQHCSATARRPRNRCHLLLPCMR